MEGTFMVSTSDIDAKQRIMQAAKRMFAHQGFNGTSIREICEEAGANVALVSYHFGGKDQLFRAIFENFFRPERYEPFDKLKGNPEEALRAFIQVLVAYRFEEPEMQAICFQELTMQSKRAEILREYLTPVWGLLHRILAEGKQLSVFRIESIEYAMTSIMGMVLFPPKTTLIESMLDKYFDQEEMIRHVTTYAFRLLGASEAAEEGE
jgi:AcrR family transcriptional regulator